MSVSQLAVGAASAAAVTLFKLYNQSNRYIGSILAPCVVSEHHNDTAIITDHPVEFGSPISDHMYQLPKKVDIEVVYSLSSGINGLKMIASAVGLANKSAVTLRDYYDQFLKIQNTQQLIKINTGKRTYQNMVIESIECITDVNTENMLKLTLRCREVIIVTTSTTQVPAANQADPAATAAPTQQNTTQLSQPSSTLSNSFSNSVVSTYNPTIPTMVP